MLKYEPSHLAASALCLARRVIFGAKVEWPAYLVEATRYPESIIRPCIKDMIILAKGIETCTLQAIRKKFLLPKFDEVASIRIEQTAVLRK
jgi:hypothetical protein